ncbi:MAG: DNA polymerase domain-containing protein, partial [Candidatus Xenobia bacterium]
GMVAKQRQSPYEYRRSGAWRKIKTVQTADCVIGGWTKPDKNTRSHFKSLVLGLWEGDRLVHVGNAGSGLSEAMLAEVAQELAPLQVDRCPFTPPPVLDDQAVWVRPEKVCFVKYQERTKDGIMRFPVFLGMRPDKGPEECLPETAGSAPLLGPDAVNLALEVDGIPLKFTNLDKIYFPADGITKRDLVNFYADVAPLLVPHLRDRPLNLKRYPDGITGEHFFQKHGEKFPPWVPRHEEHGVLCNDRTTLLFLANLGCIDQNPLQSRIGSLDTPDWMLLDLDPQECPYDKIVSVALVLRGLLEQLGLQGYPKTTGGRGMHIYVPVAPGYSFEQTTMLAQVLARVAASRHPDLITLARAVSRREKNRVYIDYPQGGRGRSISAPYCVRPVPGATVATPLRWEEVKLGLHPSRFTLRSVRDRLDAQGDIFGPVLKGEQRLQDAISRLETLISQ